MKKGHKKINRPLILQLHDLIQEHQVMPGSILRAMLQRVRRKRPKAGTTATSCTETMENGEGGDGKLGIQMVDVESRNRRRRQQEEAAAMNGRKGGEGQETIELRPTNRELISSPLLRDEEKQKEENEGGRIEVRH
jgi:hypothetical protein